MTFPVPTLRYRVSVNPGTIIPRNLHSFPLGTTDVYVLDNLQVPKKSLRLLIILKELWQHGLR